MPISKEDDKSLWEQYNIILLSHIVMYCFLPFLFLQFLFLLQFIFLIFYFILQPMLILTGSSLCHKFELHFMSLMPQRERSSRLSVLKLSHAHLKRRWQEFVGTISYNTSFTHCPVLNLILAWFGWKLGGN